ncbi:hypothetical protein BLNAU_19370 [Blattamonas nauphoetae]|uniref:PH domain-containing protein n=1 Tax=Blattamonas nauphoetae TaxID=2049346 RepID=A0ABQ9X4X4_9EUKA|nr:hypothetical protein BLNAU_19370 [Blattamonas nauphoetae]
MDVPIGVQPAPTGEKIEYKFDERSCVNYFTFILVFCILAAFPIITFIFAGWVGAIVIVVVLPFYIIIIGCGMHTSEKTGAYILDPVSGTITLRTQPTTLGKLFCVRPTEDIVNLHNVTQISVKDQAARVYYPWVGKNFMNRTWFVIYANGNHFVSYIAIKREDNQSIVNWARGYIAHDTQHVTAQQQPQTNVVLAFPAETSQPANAPVNQPEYSSNYQPPPSDQDGTFKVA